MIFAALRDKNLKLFTNCKLLFLEVSMVFRHLVYVKILTYRDKREQRITSFQIKACFTVIR